LNHRQIVNKLLEYPFAYWSPLGADALASHLLTTVDRDTEFDLDYLKFDYPESPSLQEYALSRISGYRLRPALANLGIVVDDIADDDEIDSAIRQVLLKRTTLMEFPGGVIVKDF
jgi:hypothetical protein